MAERKTFAQLGRVEAIRQLFKGSGYTPFGEPLPYESKAHDHVIMAQKLMLEGMDFNLEYFPLKHLGYKSVIAVTGELYAAVARPRTLSVRLGVSSKLDYDQIKEIWSGILIASRFHGYSGLSLDLQPSKNGLVISLSAGGLQDGHCEVANCAFHRNDVRTKDLIVISGRLGAAYFGQQVLEHRSNELEKYKMMVGDYLKPELDANILAQLKAADITPSKGYFVTVGLSDAVLRLCRDTGLGAKIYADHIPFEGGSFELGKALDIDPLSAAMNGGDDMRLLYVIPIEKFERFNQDFPTFEIIGHMALPEAGSVLVSPDGLEHPITAQGW